MFTKLTFSLLATVPVLLSAATSTITPVRSDAAGPTTTTLGSSLNPSHFGQNVKFTATVTPSTATGTVTFFHGSTEMGTGTLNDSGIATFSTFDLATGAHTITATYNGDPDDESSTSAPLTQFVGKASTTTALTSAPNPSTVGEKVTLTATVTPSTAKGTVTFYHGTESLGTGTLKNGVATLGVTTLTKGTHSLTATYAGNSDDAGSTSPAVDQVVD